MKQGSGLFMFTTAFVIGVVICPGRFDVAKFKLSIEGTCLQPQHVIFVLMDSFRVRPTPSDHNHHYTTISALFDSDTQTGENHVNDRIAHVTRASLKAASAALDPLLGPFPGPRILIYHQVGLNLGREMEVSTETFSKQLDWLQANGIIVDLTTAIERRGEPDVDNLFVLTFDDGFEDVHRNAFPLMKDREIPFTLYLTTKPIETGEPLDSRYPDARPLTWVQVNEMAATNLATIGVHTHTHLDLRSAPSDQIVQELDRSNDLIYEHTGSVPSHFAYPWGWWSRTADPFVRDRYETATVGSTSPVTSESDLAALGRLPIQQSDGLIWFTRRVTRGLRLENTVRRWRAGYSGP